MADVYREVVETHPDAFVVYLSTGAWNTAGTLVGFLARHGYPRGPLLLTDWGPDPGRLVPVRAGAQAPPARAALRGVRPQLRWLLVGDDGQHDPSLYAEAARDHPGRVAAVAIRQLSTAEQVAGHGTPRARDAGSPEELRPATVRDGSRRRRAARRAAWQRRPYLRPPVRARTPRGTTGVRRWCRGGARRGPGSAAGPGRSSPGRGAGAASCRRC